MSPGGGPADIWAVHDAMWRPPAQVAALWSGAARPHANILRHRQQGQFWETLERLGVTLLVSREYEHLLMALTVGEAGPRVSFLPLPHPSGLAVDQAGGRVMAACTRNPNQVMELRPAAGMLPRGDLKDPPQADGVLMPAATTFYPGSLYLHDLAFVGGALHGNAVAHNAVVHLMPGGVFEPVWWPKSMEGPQGPDFGRNYLQLNSIAAGGDLATSFFSASAEKPGARRPGQQNFPVDGRGVIFSGASGQPICRGLTRPHSARLWRGRVWVDNSGYGELGVVRGGRLEVAAHLPGWTRGLYIKNDVALVGVSRVLPRFKQYAPGLEVDKSRCGVYAVDLKTGRRLGSLTWPQGNQIFAIEALPRAVCRGLPFGTRPAPKKENQLFYAYHTGQGAGRKQDHER